MPCPRVKECPCPYTDCENYARCCDCIINHNNRHDLPRCIRTHPAVKPPVKKEEEQ